MKAGGLLNRGTSEGRDNGHLLLRQCIVAVEAQDAEQKDYDYRSKYTACPGKAGMGLSDFFLINFDRASAVFFPFIKASAFFEGSQYGNHNKDQ